MQKLFAVLALAAGPGTLLAQRGARPDSAARDSVARDLKTVTIVTAPADQLRPAGIVRVDATALRRAPAITTWELLRQTAGLEVHQQGQGPGFASNASLRGFSSDHSTDLALWIDGVPVNEPVNGHAEGYNDWSLLFRDAVRDVDVTQGPTSPLFGNFALAGVVNVRTLERFAGTRVSADAGSYGRAGTTVLTGFDHGARGGGVLGLHLEREDGFRPNAGFAIGQAHARVVHELTPTTSIDVGGEFYGSNWKSAGFLGEDEFARREYGIVSNASDGGLKRRAQERVSLRVITGSMLWRSTVYATQGQWQLYLTIPPAGGKFEGSGSQTEERDKRLGFGATSAATWLLGAGELTVGGEARWDRSRYANWFTTSRRRDSTQADLTANQAAGALFVDSHFDLSNRLRLDLGGRADAFRTRASHVGEEASDGSTGVVSPKIGARYELTGHMSSHVNLSRGFRSTDGIVEDPALPVITAWAWEWGARYDATRGHLAATLFRMDVSNEQTFDPISGNSSSGGTSRRQGLELQWAAPLGDVLALDGEWTFNDARYRHLTIVSEDGDEPPEEVDGLRVYNTAEYVGSAGLVYTPRDASWHARVGGNWVGPYSPFEQPGEVTGGYGLMHAAVSFRLVGADVDVGIRNVLDRAYPEIIAGHKVAPGQPRSGFLSVRRNF